MLRIAADFSLYFSEKLQNLSYSMESNEQTELFQLVEMVAKGYFGSIFTGFMVKHKDFINLSTNTQDIIINLQ